MIGSYAHKMRTEEGVLNIFDEESSKIVALGCMDLPQWIEQKIT